MMEGYNILNENFVISLVIWSRILAQPSHTLPIFRSLSSCSSTSVETYLLWGYPATVDHDAAINDITLSIYPDKIYEIDLIRTTEGGHPKQAAFILRAVSGIEEKFGNLVYQQKNISFITGHSKSLKIAALLDLKLPDTISEKFCDFYNKTFRCSTTRRIRKSLQSTDLGLQSSSSNNNDMNRSNLSYPDSPTPGLRDESTCISVGTITEPDCLGPCEPGTSVILEGIVCQDTKKGVLVVTVECEGKSYYGTLLEYTKHDQTPPSFCKSRTSNVESKTSEGQEKEVLIVCPEPNCHKKYKHNGLRYHQTYAHSASDSRKIYDTATKVSSPSPTFPINYGDVSSSLKPIQPKPTIMGEPTLNLALDSLKKDKSKDKDKERDNKFPSFHLTLTKLGMNPNECEAIKCTSYPPPVSGSTAPLPSATYSTSSHLKSQMGDSKNEINQYETATTNKQFKEYMCQLNIYQEKFIKEELQKLKRGIHRTNNVQCHSHIKTSSSYSSKPHKDYLSGYISSHSKSNHYGDNTKQKGSRVSSMGISKGMNIMANRDSSCKNKKGTERERSESSSRETKNNVTYKNDS